MRARRAASIGSLPCRAAPLRCSPMPSSSLSRAAHCSLPHASLFFLPSLFFFLLYSELEQSHGWPPSLRPIRRLHDLPVQTLAPKPPLPPPSPPPNPGRAPPGRIDGNRFRRRRPPLEPPEASTPHRTPTSSPLPRLSTAKTQILGEPSSSPPLPQPVPLPRRWELCFFMGSNWQRG